MASYGSVSGVQALLPSYGTLTTGTVPTTSQVTQWLAEGYARINRSVQSAGYSAPIDSGADVYAEFTALNDLYAGAYCLRARGIETANGEEEGRDVVWLREFNTRLAELVSSDLTLSGVSLAAAGTKKRIRVRTLQLRKVDGYSGAYEGDTVEYDNPSE